ncbi:MAG: DUF523 domain-containing protein [Desulfobulbaceae bacterium]|nr:DUF523 domain-containing protein [Desulfobulbaceae bacterium]
MTPPILVSACLVGLCSRYDGESRTNPACLHALTGRLWVPLCPEQLGGLPTPRPAADICGGDGDDVFVGAAHVITKKGVDVTASFVRGARQCEQVAQMLDIRQAFLKARSPSCAVTGVVGVTAALLRRRGLALVEF